MEMTVDDISLDQLQQELARRQLESFNEEDDQRLVERQGKDRLVDALKAEQARREEERKPREETTVLDVVADVAGGANEAALDIADLATSPFRATGKLITGRNVRTPSQVLGEYGIGGDVRYVDNQSVSDLLNKGGYAAAMGASFTPVQRAPEMFKNIASDLAGFGSSELTTGQMALLKTSKAVSEADNLRLGKEPSEWNEQEIFQEAQSYLDKGNIIFNRSLMNDYETELARLTKLEENPSKASKNKPIPELVEPVPVGGIGTVMRHMVDELGLPPDKVLESIRKRGGLEFRDMDELIEMDKQFTKASGEGGGPGWYDRNFLPVADVVRKYVDNRVGSIFERAIESNMRYSDVLSRTNQDLIKVADLVEADLPLKKILLDIPVGHATLGDARRRIAQLGGNVGAFNKFVKQSEELNTKARSTLYKETEKLDDSPYFHTQKRARKTGKISEYIGTRGEAKTESPSALRNRSRGATDEMTDDEVMLYENPLLSQMRYMADTDQLVRLSQGLNLRPSLGLSDDLEPMWKEIQAKLERDGFDTMRANSAKELIATAHNGSRKVPPPAIRAFMSLAYGGTLSQLKSAVLNPHDAFVAAFTQGGANTLKGMRKTLMQEFGKSIEELGLSNQSVGEYVKSVGQTLDDPRLMDKVAEMAAKFTDGAMLISGFKTMDKFGKATVLKAAVEKMRSSAREGTLFDNFSDIATRDELRQIRPYLKKGTAAKDMPQNIAAIVEELAFVALGKQQLISYAGRPLGYLGHPILRPAYAMTGFAIKQQALLRDMIGKKLAQGDYAGAGMVAARYVGYAGTGYAGIDTARDAVFKREPKTQEDFLLAMTDQLMGAAFMNKLDTQSIDKFTGNPVDFLMLAFMPPGGLTEAAGQDVATFIKSLGDEDVKPPKKLLERTPLFGDFYKYWWAKED